LDKKFGKDLNWLFELRGVGDYGVTIHVSRQNAEKAIVVAEGFLRVIESLIQGEAG
jgi:uncharacterized protein (UPF0332 family)